MSTAAFPTLCYKSPPITLELCLGIVVHSIVIFNLSNWTWRVASFFFYNWEHCKLMEIKGNKRKITSETQFNVVQSRVTIQSQHVTNERSVSMKQSRCNKIWNVVRAAAGIFKYFGSVRLRKMREKLVGFVNGVSHLATAKRQLFISSNSNIFGAFVFDL